MHVCVCTSSKKVAQGGAGWQHDTKVTACSGRELPQARFHCPVPSAQPDPLSTFRTNSAAMGA